MSELTPPNPNGFCQCGCGERAPLARQTDRRLGYVRGEPLRFIRGHVGNLKRRDRLTADLWHVEDRGHESPCWIWNGHVNRRTGYCRVKFQGRFQLPHRVLYEQEVGPIPEGHDIDHLCAQRDCVRPSHLEPVTRRINIRRSATAKFTEDDIRLIRRSTLSGTEIAQLLGVSRGHIYAIRHHRAWPDVK